MYTYISHKNDLYFCDLYLSPFQMPIYAKDTQQFKETAKEITQFIKKLRNYWAENPELTANYYDTYIPTQMKAVGIPQRYLQEIIDTFYNIVMKWARKWYGQQINDNQETYDYIESLVDEDIVFPSVRRKVYAMIARWKMDASKRPPLPPLQAIAKDGQNVHTGFVNKQMFEMLAILEKEKVPRDQHTLDEILIEWMKFKPYDKGMETVLGDIRKWGKKDTIFKTNDLLYRITIRSVWAKVKRSTESSELVKRLWEECKESVGMCAHGHISRLTNVFVGFDDAFTTPLSSKELFQEEFAKLSQLTNDQEKMNTANALFEKYEIPVEEHSAWVDALCSSADDMM